MKPDRYLPNKSILGTPFYSASYFRRYKQRKEGHMENPNIKILTTSRDPGDPKNAISR